MAGSILKKTAGSLLTSPSLQSLGERSGGSPPTSPTPCTPEEGEACFFKGGPRVQDEKPQDSLFTSTFTFHGEVPDSRDPNLILPVASAQPQPAFIA